MTFDPLPGECAQRSDNAGTWHPNGRPRDFEFPNTEVGFAVLAERLRRLTAPPAGIVIGMEATARYWDNLYIFLVGQGYRVVLLHPGQTHQLAQQRGRRAKTDRLDAPTIARVLLSDEVRPACVPILHKRTADDRWLRSNEPIAEGASTGNKQKRYT